MASSWQRNFFDIHEEKYAGGEPNACNNIRNDPVFPDSVGHELENKHSHPQNNKVRDERESISQIIEFILKSR